MTALFKNRVVRNTVSLFAGQSGAQVLALVFIAYLSSKLSKDDYGSLCFALNFAVVLNVLSEYGMWTLLVRNMARDLSTARSYFWNSVVLKLVMAFLAAAVGAVVLLLFYDQPGQRELRVLSCLAGGWLLFNAWYFSAAAVFRAFQEHHLDGTLSFAGKLLYVGAGIVVVLVKPDVRWIALLFTLAMAVQCGMAFVLVVKRHAPFSFTFSTYQQKYLVRNAWLFFTINSFTTLHLKFGHLVIGAKFPASEVGFYNIASMLVLVPIVLANAFVQSMYPVLSECHDKGDSEFWPKVRLGMRWLGALASPVIIFMTIDGRRIIDTVFPGYGAALVPMQILLWGLGLDFFNPFSGHVLYVMDQQRKVIVLTGICVAANIVANLALVPLYGIVGASCAMVISLSIMFWGYAFLLRRWLPLRRFFSAILMPLLIAALLAPLPYFLSGHVNFVVNGLLYCAVYTAVLFATRTLRWADTRVFGGARAVPVPAPADETIAQTTE